MRALTTFEKALAKWYGSLQPIPDSVTKWLATNLWIIASAGVIVMACMMFVYIPALFTVLSMDTTVPSALSAYVPNVHGLAWAVFGVNIIGYLVAALLLSSATGPLRTMQKKGWDRVFWTLLANLTFGVISGILLFSPLSIFVSVTSVAIGGYFLFGIRNSFVKRRLN